jgi:hypothetical protein
MHILKYLLRLLLQLAEVGVRVQAQGPVTEIGARDKNRQAKYAVLGAR